MRPCPEDEVLAALAGGDLSDDDRRSVTQHLDGCPSCAALVAELGRAAAPDDDPPAPPRVGSLEGRVLGEFVLREKIGQGGFGAVYRAEQPALEREAVVKVLHQRLSGDAEGVARFMREARVASRIDHPFAAHIYAFGAEPDGLLWIAMEYARGTPFDRKLALGGPRPLPELAWFLDRLAEVVHAAHERGIIHRDLKPANVMVVERAGRELPKLLDLGIAKLVAGGGPEPVAGPSAKTDLTQGGAALGSPPYMAPELWGGSAGADVRSDVYALGVLTYEAATGRRPFRATSVAELATQHRKKAVPAVGDGLPAALDGFFARALAKKPADRFATALELAAAFRRAVGLGDEDDLPRLPEALLAPLPQPLAEAGAQLNRARNPHQARDAVRDLLRGTTRLVAAMALAARAHLAVEETGDPGAVGEALRALRRRELTDAEWVELARSLCARFRQRPGDHPLPALVAFLAHSQAFARVWAASGAGHGGHGSADQLREWMVPVVAALAELLGDLSFLAHHPLVVVQGGQAELWTGQRRAHRAVLPIAGTAPAEGRPTLVDGGGRPVLSLWPFVQALSPQPGSPPELFVFDGSARDAARLYAIPAGFQALDPAVWDALAELVTGPLPAGEGSEPEAAPYLGLRAYSVDERDRFFGRDAEIVQGVNRLQVVPMLVVVGPSGAGKSSFVHAGLLPALGPEWRAVTIRPGRQPLRALTLDYAHPEDPPAIFAARLAGGARAVLVIDQLEELFTQCHDAAERERFAALVAACADRGTRVIMTLRDDFLMAAEALFRTRLAPSLLLLGIPSRDDLLRIVVEPARRAGHEFDDPSLPGEIVDAVAGQPGALPLVSFCGARLWERRDRQFHQLTQRAYRALGGVSGALAQHAESVVAGMTREDLRVVRELFRQLVTADGARAALTRRELVQVLGVPHAAELVARLVDARLLVTADTEDGDRIELVHETLATAWPRLAEWRREDREGAHFRDQLRAAARQWHARDRARGMLWRDDALAELSLWRSRHRPALTETEEAFVVASLADAARGRRLVRALTASAVIVLLAASSVLYLLNRSSNEQRRRAEELTRQSADRLTAQHVELGRAALLAGDPSRALAQLLEVRRRGAKSSALDFMLASAAQPHLAERVRFVGSGADLAGAELDAAGTRVVTAGKDGTARVYADGGEAGPVLSGAQGDLVAAFFTPDGERIVTASWDGKIRIHDPATGRQLAASEGTTTLRAVALGADGTLVTGDNGGEVAAWDTRTAARRTTWTERHESTVFALAVADDGDLVASASLGGALWIWSLRQGRLVQRLQPEGGDRFTALAFRGDRLAAARGAQTEIWDARTAKLVLRLAGHEGEINHVTFSPSGASVATAGNDGTARVWRLPGGEPMFVVTHGGPVKDVRFAPSGRILATASSDGTARLWDAEGGVPLALFAGHQAPVVSVRFDPGESRLVTASLDGTARLWEIRGEALPRIIAVPDSVALSASISPDGSIVTRDLNVGRPIRRWDPATGRTLASLVGHEAGVMNVRFADQGRTIVSGDDAGIVRVWRDDGTVVHVLGPDGPASPVNVLEVRGDGGLVAAGYGDGAVRLWDAGGASVGRMPAGSGQVMALALLPDGIFVGWTEGRMGRFSAAEAKPIWTAISPKGAMNAVSSRDGRRVVVGDRDHFAYVLDAATGHIEARLPHAGPVTRVLLDDGESRLLTGGEEGILRLWDVAGGRLVREMRGNGTILFDIDFSPDGTLAVAAGANLVADVWDLASGERVQRLAGHRLGLLGARFLPDGRALVTSSLDGRAIVWNVPHLDPAHLDRAACLAPYEVVSGELRRTAVRTCEHH